MRNRSSLNFPTAAQRDRIPGAVFRTYQTGRAVLPVRWYSHTIASDKRFARSWFMAPRTLSSRCGLTACWPAAAGELTRMGTDMTAIGSTVRMGGSALFFTGRHGLQLIYHTIRIMNGKGFSSRLPQTLGIEGFGEIILGAQLVTLDPFLCFLIWQRA